MNTQENSHAALYSLRGQLLIAMPSLRGSEFGGAVMYICDHTEDGALGIVINRPLELRLDELLEQMDLAEVESDRLVFSGGPVQLERGFVLHRGERRWQHSQVVASDICLTTSRDILDAIGQGEGPEEFLMALGYAGWSPGQLEEEIAGNVWLNCDADADLLFSVPWEQRLETALNRMGVDPSQLSSSVGHA
ncbi:MAG: YqgE/AlgH family protein [Alteromonadaceae bacterium]|nr:YqgE/AlgH family protein [Alteromonadaceae bacterium]|tara:strand:+ start:1219 stop:1794 length:576 start_codon:yes stop_codon:yes gene_type:complete